MMIAKIRLPDGRIAKFEVPEGTTPEQVMAFATQSFGQGEPETVSNEAITGAAPMTSAEPEQMPVSAREGSYNQYLQEPQKPQFKRTMLEQGAGLAQAALQGQTFGFGDELQGSLKGAGYGIGAALTGREPIGQAASRGYMQGRDVARQELAASRQDMPVTTGITELAGGLASPATGAGFVGRGASTLGRAGRGAAVAGATGAAFGAGTAEQDRLAGAARGAATGAVLGGAVSGAGSVGADIMQKGRQYLQSNPNGTVGQIVEHLTGNADNVVRMIEKGLSKAVILGAPLRKAESRQVADAAKKITELTPKAVTDGKQELGSFISESAERGLDRINRKFNFMYEKGIYSKLPDGKKTQATANATLAKIQELAEELTPSQRQFLAGIQRDLTDEAGLNLAKLRSIKSQIGSATQEAKAGISQGAINDLYSALRHDFYDSVAASGGQKALKNLAKADKLYEREMGEASASTALKKLMGGNKELTTEQVTGLADKVMKSAMEKTDNTALLKSLKQRMLPEDFAAIGQSIVRKMNDEDLRGFLKTYNGFSKNGKEILFGDMVPQLDQIAKMLKSLRMAPLNTSSTAIAGVELATIAGGAALRPEALAGAGAAYGLSSALARPEALGRAARIGAALTKPIRQPRAVGQIAGSNK